MKFKFRYMSLDNLDSVIEGFIKDRLYPQSFEREDVSCKYEELKNLLPGYHLFQSGSYARRTATTPVKDLDVICDSENPSESLGALYSQLESSYS